MWMLTAWLVSSKVEFLFLRTADVSSFEEKIGASTIETGKNKNIRTSSIVVEVTQKLHSQLVSFLKTSGEGRLLEEEQVSSSSSSSELIISDSRLSNAVLPDITDGFCAI